MTASTALTKEDGLSAAEYALGVMQGEARQAFARRMEADAVLAAEVRQWDEHFVDFTGDIAAVTPSRHIETALENRLFPASTSVHKTTFWNSLGFWRGLAIASLAAVVALGAWNYRTPAEIAAKGLVAQIVGDAKAVTLVAYYDEAKGELRLNRTQGSAANGRSFELWLIAGKDAPVSLGVLPPDASGTFAIPAQLRTKLSGGTLAISDEPQGGSTTGAPTGAVLATGQLTSV